MTATTNALAMALPYEYDRSRLVAVLRVIEQRINALAFTGAKTTWNPGSIADGDCDTTTLAVPGVREGVKQHCRVAAPYDLQGLQATAHVSADDQVTIVLSNRTGSPVNLDEGEWGVMVETFPVAQSII